MTYHQLMEVMVRSSSMMHEGILRENKQMVQVGANFILPILKAPNHTVTHITICQCVTRMHMLSMNIMLHGLSHLHHKKYSLSEWVLFAMEDVRDKISELPKWGLE
ncbi:MAG: hypothetical protein ABFS32_17405 [Bacteroidota bacterium]